ncbi:transporter [Vibrio splendidus]|nr:transporter [Vibrio splendidus]MCC4788060.1 transporter [Vibrio splendidus]
MSGLLTSTVAIANEESNQTAEQAAKELANPNTAYASLNLKLQYSGGYDGGGDSFATVLQPTLPFPMENGDKIIFRPAISYVQNDFNVNTPTSSQHMDQSGVSDISFDLAYAPKMEGGTIVAFGLFASLPTGSNDLTADQFAVGSEFMVGRASSERVVGVFPNHLYGVSGDGVDHSDTRINKTSTQVFWVEILGGGWTVGSAPTFSYDWNKDQAEIPLNISVSKTTVLNGRPWKFGIEANYYLEKDEETRPDFMSSFNISPVVENKLASLFD